MDELVHHCKRELSFDGELGCNVSRLKDFIVDFYNSYNGPQQVVDDAFCAFVWSVVVHQPAVRVGVVPPGTTSEVYVAPQASAKRKAVAQGEELVEDVPTLQVIENAWKMSLDELKEQHGNELRIAVDAETSFSAITGSHIKPAKLTPMIYTALQLITRGREEGITTVELGRKTKYDQKTCFYVTKQLVELGFIIKVRRGGVGNYTCIHKYFVERSPFWQQIQQETHDGEVVVTGSNVQRSDVIDDAVVPAETPQISFDTIDGRHLSSLLLVRHRIVRLLKASINYMHTSNNLLVAIGFKNPTKTDRRFFQTRLRELIQQRVIERVLVPHGKAKNRMIKCIHLVEHDSQLPEGGVVIGAQEVDDDEKDLASGVPDGYPDVKTHLTIHKQVSNLLIDAGLSGLTLQEICTSLGNFDKRTLELLLSRATKNCPPPHLHDLGIIGVMETYIRERRHRYFTVAAYKEVRESERLQDPTHVDVDLSRVGDFAELDASLFYSNDVELCAYMDSLKDKGSKGNEKELSLDGGKGKKRKRLDGGGEGHATDGEEAPPKRKRGRPRKTPVPDSSQPPKKRGRPRKHPLPENGVETSTPKKRGRPPKRTLETVVVPGNDSIESNFMPDTENITQDVVMADGASPYSGALNLESGPSGIVEATLVEEGLHIVNDVASRLNSGVIIEPESTSKHPSCPLELREDFEIGLPSTIPEQTVTTESIEERAILEVDGEEWLASPPRAEPSTQHIDTPCDAQTASGTLSTMRVTLEKHHPHTAVTSQAAPSEEPAITQDEHLDNAATMEIDSLEVAAPEPWTESSLLPVESPLVDLLSAHVPQIDLLIDPLLREDVSDEMRGVSPGPSAVRPAKRLKTAGPSDRPRSGVNISALRRENELYRVIEELGGIINLHSKGIFDGHATLLDTLSQEGEPTSAPPGTRLDKRTADASLRNLENRGRIKMLKTSLMSASGVNKPACLSYLPDTHQDKINEYLRQLSQSTPSVSSPTPIKILDEAVEFGSSRRRPHRPIRFPGEAEGESSCHPRTSDAPAGQPSLHDLKTTEIDPIPDRPSKKKRSKTSAEAKAALLKKAQEARRQREEDWGKLLTNVHPEPVKGTLVAQIRGVRARFMQSTSIKDVELWEGEIRKAIKETALATKNTISKPKRLTSNHRKPVMPPPMVAGLPEKSIASIIAQQGTPILQSIRPKGKGKEKEGEPSDKSFPRRTRFHWTRDFDELARDASAIIRARCRELGRLDLSAFDQVFPAVPRNSVRQRVVHLRDAPAEDLYMRRLEDHWHTLWIQHRGTDHLGDDDPQSPSNFDLVKHIEFLRNHVDKNALRVGFVERKPAVELPESVEELKEHFEMERNPITTPLWNFMWSSVVEEGREKQFLSHAFTKMPEVVSAGVEVGDVATAEAALKMVFGTPKELYDPDSGARLLHSIGKQPVSVATSSLMNQGVLSKLVRDPKKSKPGRTLKISDVNLNSIGGILPRELFQDATALEDIVIDGGIEEMEWPLDAHDGDLATLLQLVSEEQVSFHVDTTRPQSGRARIDWNSKKADDDDIEAALYIKFAMRTMTESELADNTFLETHFSGSEFTGADSGDDADHGKAVGGSTAACMFKTSRGMINCSRCLGIVFSTFVASLSEPDAGLAHHIMEGIRAAGSSGISKEGLPKFDVEPERVFDLTQRMSSLNPPIVFWTGFTPPVVVASDHCKPWAVTVLDEPYSLVLPRRWLDVHGLKVEEFWTAALRAVVGMIFLHPGIRQGELRWRLKSVYDRREVLEAVTFLEQDGMIEARLCEDERAGTLGRLRSVPGWAVVLDEEEEQRIFWFMSKDRHWYRV